MASFRTFLLTTNATGRISKFTKLRFVFPSASQSGKLVDVVLVYHMILSTSIDQGKRSMMLLCLLNFEGFPGDLEVTLTGSVEIGNDELSIVIHALWGLWLTRNQLQLTLQRSGILESMGAEQRQHSLRGDSELRNILLTTHRPDDKQLISTEEISTGEGEPRTIRSQLRAKPRYDDSRGRNLKKQPLCLCLIRKPYRCLMYFKFSTAKLPALSVDLYHAMKICDSLELNEK